MSQPKIYYRKKTSFVKSAANRYSKRNKNYLFWYRRYIYMKKIYTKRKKGQGKNLVGIYIWRNTNMKELRHRKIYIQNDIYIEKYIQRDIHENIFNHTKIFSWCYITIV